MFSERLTLHTLLLVPLAAQVAILSFLWRRGLVRTFPVFFAYLFVIVARTLAALYLYETNLTLAFYAYWIGEAISLVLGLAVIRELILHVLKPYEALEQVAHTIFRWVAAALLVLAVLSAALPAGEDNVFMATVLPVARAVRIVQFGLLLFLFALSSYFGFGWRHHVLGIALGFAVFVSVEITAVSIRSEVGRIGHEIWSLITRLSYAAATFIWLWYIASPQPVNRVSRLPARDGVERWNQALLQLLQR